MTTDDKTQVEADDIAMHLVLLGLPVEIFATVDSCDAHAVWERVKRLMHGTNMGKQEMDTELLNELDKLTSIPRESIKSYYTAFVRS